MKRNGRRLCELVNVAAENSARGVHVSRRGKITNYYVYSKKV